MERHPDRARRHTAASVLRRIDDDTVAHLMEAQTHPDATSGRVQALDPEWDIDRTPEVEAAAAYAPGNGTQARSVHLISDRAQQPRSVSQ